MIKVNFRSTELFTVEAEGSTHIEVFAEIAKLAEVFSAKECGMCKSHDIVPTHRTVDGVSHYEMKCNGCNARLTLAQSKKGGTLYPRRRYHKDQSEVKSGRAVAEDWIPNGGWQKWQNERDDSNEEAAPPPKKKGR